MAAFLVTAVQSSALAASSTVTVINQSGQTIVAFYYRQTNDSQWYNANFGTLANGDSFYWTIDAPYRYIDLGFKLADGNFQERSGIDTYSDFTVYVNH